MLKYYYKTLKIPKSKIMILFSKHSVYILIKKILFYFWKILNKFATEIYTDT